MSEPNKGNQKRKTARRGNGEGSIFQRADGRWVATVTIGYDATGKRQRRTVYAATKAAVQEKLAGLHVQSLQGTLAAVDKITVAEHLDRWLEHSVKPSRRATTHDVYEAAVRLHIKPLIGGLQLVKLTPNHIRGLYSQLTNQKGAGPNVIRQVHTVLRKALKEAARDGLTPRNACDTVSPPRIPKPEISPLDGTEAQALLDAAAEEPCHAIIAMALGTGMRIGELFALTWDDVNLKESSVHVRYTMEEAKGCHARRETKTAKGRRRIDLPAFVVDALWQHKATLLASGLATCEWVFPNPFGKPYRRGRFHRDVYKPLLAKAGLPPIRFHDLRHTSATMLLSQGVHPKVVQERLGHSQIAVTLDTYSHVLPGLQKEAAGKLDSMLSNPKKTAAS